MILRYVAAILIALSVPAVASASTECTGKVQRVWSGDSGTVMIFLVGGGPSPVIIKTDPNHDGALAVAMTAATTGRNVTIRYAADGVSCSASLARTDFVGIFLEPN